MAVTRDQLDSIARNRRVYLNTPDGREALRDRLVSLGLFRDQRTWLAMIDKPERHMPLIVEALLLLADLGVLIEENYGCLINAMAAMPIPKSEQMENA